MYGTVRETYVLHRKFLQMSKDLSGNFIDSIYIGSKTPSLIVNIP